MNKPFFINFKFLTNITLTTKKKKIVKTDPQL